MTRDVLVVIGTGGMGLAAARRCGSGQHILLADVSEGALETASAALRDEGHDVDAHPLDITDRAAVDAVAATAASLGPVRRLVHTAGLSPVQATAARIVAVDLVGAANVLEAFEPVVVPGGAAVVISSMSGHLLPPLGTEDERALAQASAGDLPSLAVVQHVADNDPGIAYALAKQAVSIRVRAAALAWGRRGARVNAISPGVIATTMGRDELDGASGAFMRAMVDGSATARLGTPDDIAAAAAFLLGPAASFITGVDLLVDGGVVAAMRCGQIDFGAATSR